MRLMQIDTGSYALSRPTAGASSYVGTINVYSSAGTVTGQLSLVSDRFSVELYGDCAASMYSLICPAGTDIKKNDRVTLTDGDYTVISVMTYRTHVTATLERTANYGERSNQWT